MLLLVAASFQLCPVPPWPRDVLRHHGITGRQVRHLLYPPFSHTRTHGVAIPPSLSLSFFLSYLPSLALSSFSFSPLTPSFSLTSSSDFLLHSLPVRWRSMEPDEIATLSLTMCLDLSIACPLQEEQEGQFCDLTHQSPTTATIATYIATGSQGLHIFPHLRDVLNHMI